MMASENPLSPQAAPRGDPIKTGNWTNGLFGCFNNIGLCAMTYILPCVTFGRMAESLGDDCVYYGLMYMIPFLNCYLESQYRETIRERRGIMDSTIMDILTIVFCPPCALTQESMEVHEIQAEELRLGAIAGGAPPGAFANTPQAHHQPTYPAGIPNPGLTPDEPYYPPSQGTWENSMDMNRQ